MGKKEGSKCDVVSWYLMPGVSFWKNVYSDPEGSRRFLDLRKGGSLAVTSRKITAAISLAEPSRDVRSGPLRQLQGAILLSRRAPGMAFPSRHPTEPRNQALTAFFSKTPQRQKRVLDPHTLLLSPPTPHPGAHRAQLTTECKGPHEGEVLCVLEIRAREPSLKFRVERRLPCCLMFVFLSIPMCW